MTSYARKIDRPRGWSLEPFETWTDSYNVRRGNPDLEPELINSFELASQTKIKIISLTVEGYYRQTTNKIERIRTVYAENVTLHTSENVGSDNALGLEVMCNLGLYKWWNVDLTTNVFNYRVTGELNGQDFSNRSSNWDFRLSNDFRLGKRIRVQLNGSYESPTVSSQGREEERFSSNLAIKYEIIPRQLNATLQMRDVLGISQSEHTYEGSDFYKYSLRKRDSSYVMLQLNYIFNNFKQARGSREEDQDMGEEDF